MSSDSPQDLRRPFVTCPSCGRLTPGNVAECIECGEPMAAIVAAFAEQRDEQRFAETVFGRATPATWIIIGLNLLVFALMVVAAQTIEPDSFRYQETLINFGAKMNSAVDSGEYWRLVAPMFLHIGLMHLSVNMYSLYIMGPQVEKLYGTSRYIVMYVLAGIGGVLGSYGVDKVLMRGDGVSAGASGALFGLMGILIVFGFRHRSELPGVFKAALSPRVYLPVLVLNLFITFMIEFIDKGAHIGGLVVGGLLAAILPFARPGERRAGFVWWTSATLAVVVVVASFVFAYRTADPIPNVDRFLSTYNDSGEKLVAANEAVQIAAAKSAVPASAAESFESAAAAISEQAGLDDRSRGLLLARRALLERASSLLGDRRGELTPETAASFAADVESDRQSWDDWLEMSGPRFRVGKRMENTNSSENSNTSGGNDGNS